MNRKNFSTWVAPYEKLCKDRDVKLTNKNKEKLHSAWISWCLREYSDDTSLNVLFWCIYNETIQCLIPNETSLFSRIPKDPNWTGGTFFLPDFK